ncbi:hypothetical protein EVAR_64055_1 [Eumeta japonica]|uniref:Uncharacterized protein n=1 Tax=Eumeta variegata TaxID=151549 RepID=A0A4C1ZUU8_EUMVA|nr:hypothetical protein EVAR_64055_1 [Eumeta japonica]
MGAVTTRLCSVKVWYVTGPIGVFLCCSQAGYNLRLDYRCSAVLPRFGPVKLEGKVGGAIRGLGFRVTVDRLLTDPLRGRRRCAVDIDDCNPSPEAPRPARYDAAAAGAGSELKNN